MSGKPYAALSSAEQLRVNAHIIRAAENHPEQFVPALHAIMDKQTLEYLPPGERAGKALDLLRDQFAGIADQLPKLNSKNLPRDTVAAERAFTQIRHALAEEKFVNPDEETPKAHQTNISALPKLAKKFYANDHGSRLRPSDTVSSSELSRMFTVLGAPPSGKPSPQSVAGLTDDALTQAAGAVKFSPFTTETVQMPPAAKGQRTR